MKKIVILLLVCIFVCSVEAGLFDKIKGAFSKKEPDLDKFFRKFKLCTDFIQVESSWRCHPEKKMISKYLYEDEAYQSSFREKFDKLFNYPPDFSIEDFSYEIVDDSHGHLVLNHDNNKYETSDVVFSEIMEDIKSTEEVTITHYHIDLFYTSKFKDPIQDLARKTIKNLVYSSKYGDAVEFKPVDWFIIPNAEHNKFVVICYLGYEFTGSYATARIIKSECVESVLNSNLKEDLKFLKQK